MINLAISNIAWPANLDRDMASFLSSVDIRHLEIAPSRLWPDARRVSPHDIDSYASLWRNHGIRIVSMQSLFYGHPDLEIFGPGRFDALAYLHSLYKIASRIGASRLVFGSPANRLASKFGLDSNSAFDSACEFFLSAGNDAASFGIKLCIEPNPAVYGCDFIVNASDDLALVRAVNSPGFSLHLDSAGLYLSGDDIADSVLSSGKSVSHVHWSAPNLDHVSPESKIDYALMHRSLQKINYDGHISIEMRPPKSGMDHASYISSSISYARKLMA